jgi:hypothetical protein
MPDMSSAIVPSIKSIVASFARGGVPNAEPEVKKFPGETIIVIRVDEALVKRAVRLATEISEDFPSDIFLVVKADDARKASSVASSDIRKQGVRANEVPQLMQVLTERSRTSEQQPSLVYIPDSTQQLAIVQGRRNHLIFGRRGVGKTALLLETKRVHETRGGKTLWVNLQTLRGLNAQQAFVQVCTKLANLVVDTFLERDSKPPVVKLADEVLGWVSNARRLDSRTSIATLTPRVREMNARFCRLIQADIFLYLDDIHYMEWNELPWFLDHVHGAVRDTSVWIKAAGIRHQCKVFTDDPPVGLQLGHDAGEINLDITLEDADKARDFLGNLLRSYLQTVGIPSPGLLFSSKAVDRLVLASGGVPRDFLEMASLSLLISRQRPNAKTVGVQDINEAAGQTSRQKVGELEDDAASSRGQSKVRLKSLNAIRKFLLEDEHSTFFQVRFSDKEARPSRYRMLQSLMDLRMVHLLKSSLSDAHSAGQRSEVYMLDLSQYSGQRLKKKLDVLELDGKHLTLRKSGTTETGEKGNTPKKLQKILRSGPYLDLELLGSDK